MRKVDSVITRLALTGIIAGIFCPATLSAYTINGSTITLEASDRNTSDNTSLIQGCLNTPSTSPAPTGYTFSKIIIQPGTGNASWLVCPLFFQHANTEIHLNANTVLEAKTGGYPGDLDCVLKATNLSNIQVTGDTGSEILMHKEEYALLPAAEWRSALNFMGCSNVTVSGLTLANTGGDGIYLDGVNGVGYCSGVTITNVVTDGCARNGVSVISVDGLTITNCTFKNTQGQGNATASGPWAGIDLEPDNSSQQLKNIEIDNCAFLNNGRRGLLIHTPQLNGSNGILSITVKNCIMQGNELYGIQVSYVPASLSDSSSIVFQDCSISDNKYFGVRVYNKARDAGTLSFTNCYLNNNNLTGDDAPFTIYSFSDATEIGGNIQLNNVVIEQPTNRLVSYYLKIDGTYALIDNVSGKVYPSGGTLSTTNTTNINVTTASNAAQSWWKMDETSGSAANDSNGNCAGTLLNSPTWVIGRIGGALALNGINQFVTVPNDASLNIGTSDFSVSLWMQRGSDSSGLNRRLIYKGANSNSEIGYAVFGTNTAIGLVLGNGLTRYSTTCTIPSLDQWHHFVCTVDRSSGKAQLYMNGVYQTGMDISAFNEADISNTRNLLIGTAAADGMLAWPGKVDDVRIYKRVLTPGEIADPDSGPSSASTHWRFNDGAGSVATDSVGRCNGMLQNNPTWTTGKIGGALTLNGSNQFVSVSNNSSDLNIGTGDFSISLWMQRGNDSSGLNRRLIYKGANLNSEIGSAIFGTNTAIGLVLGNGLTRYSTTCTIPSLNQWHHFACTVDRTSGQAKIYMNGIYQTAMDISALSGVDISNTRDLLIGAAANDGTLAWPGKVDDVRIYKRALSADEVLRLYSAAP